MEVFTTKLESVLLIKPPTVFEDFRGHYIETYEKINGTWKIKTIRITRIRVEAE